MSGQLPQLVKMANQIAANMGAVSSEDAAAQRTAEHLRKFWTPAMIQLLQDHLRAGGQDCSPLVHRALSAPPR